MLEVKSLTKYYGDHCGLENCSFKCQPQDILGILGHNGSGKTTLFRCLLGLIQKSSGEIMISDQRNRSLFFGYLPEERSLYKDITVKKQIVYLSRLKRLSPNVIEQRLEYWLKQFEMEDYQNCFIRELSKGNQQKVQFICALMHDPQVLILDEPLTGLDAHNVQLFKQIMVRLSHQGKIILLSSHQYEELEEFCSQIILLKKGQTILKGQLSDLKQKDPRLSITINRSQQNSQLKKEYILKSELRGNYIRYLLKDKKYQESFLNQLVYREVNYIKIEQITLRDLVAEA